MKSELGLHHALASRLLYTDGAELLVRYAAKDDDLEVARTRQHQLTATVKDQLKLITYADDGYATRLELPSYGPAEVVVDPQVGFGYPLVKRVGARVKDVLDRFWAGEALRTIAYDFDLRSLIVNNLRTLMLDFTRPEASDKQVPSVARTLYVVDPASGDGGVQWVQANANDNPITQRDISEHRYGELAIEVPYHGDPYASDLVTQYWPDVRRLIASRLAD